MNEEGWVTIFVVALVLFIIFLMSFEIKSNIEKEQNLKEILRSKNIIVCDKKIDDRPRKDDFLLLLTNGEKEAWKKVTTGVYDKNKVNEKYID